MSLSVKRKEGVALVQGAHLWSVRRMGSHPSGPATIAASEKGMTLSSWLSENVKALGTATRDRFGAVLPFLFKACPSSECSGDPTAST